LQRLGSEEVNEFVKNRSSDRGTEALKSIGMLAKLGELMADSQEQKNRNKKVALESVEGIDFPDDWDELSEEEKEHRLNGAIKEISK
jgi:hypothetical protein